MQEKNPAKPALLLKLIRVIAVISVVLFVSIGISTRYIWLDEAFGVLVARMDFAQLFQELKTDGSPPLYYLLLKLWTGVFGISELAVRSWSVVFYLAGAACAGALARTVFKDRNAALIAAVVYLFSPLAIRHAQNARMYSMLACLVGMSLMLYFKIITGNASYKNKLFFVLVNIAGTFTHYWFLFQMAGVGLASLLLLYGRNSNRKMFWNMCCMCVFSMLPFVVFGVPLLRLQIASNSHSFMSSPGGADLLRSVWDVFGHEKWGFAVFAALLILPAPGLGSLRVAAAKYFKNPLVSAVFVCFWALWFVPWFVSQWKPLFMVGRQTVVMLPCLSVLLGGWLVRARYPRLLQYAGIVLLLAVTAGFLQRRLSVDPRSDRRTALFLISNAKQNDAFIFTSLSWPAVEYYLMLHGFDQKVFKNTYPAELAAHKGSRNIKKMVSDMDGLKREAAELARTIASSLRADGRIYVLYGYDLEVSSVLKTELDGHFVLEREERLAGPFHEKVIVYRARRLQE